MPTITVDGEQYQVDDGQNLLSTCLSLGMNLPYFCWHPAMGSVGACRQCAVIEYKDGSDQRGRLVMSCMTPVKDGGIYSVSADAAREFRGAVIEDLMTNHPHDCPVCEEGGECHLQDMTEMTGHTNRRYRGRKRTHRNQYLGPFINHEMNRCIACYRCTRFYRDYAGGTDLQALGRNNQVYFGRLHDGMLQSGFSGNLVEVCPTGVFTDKTFSAHFVRKWDLQTAPSICSHCAVGCNTAPGAREGWNGKAQMLRRVINLYHRNINGYFLCDRGRFGYDYVNSEQRIKQPLRARSDKLIESTAATGEKIHREIDPQAAVDALGQCIAESVRGKRALIGIGSPRTSLENNYALRQLVGGDNFFAGISALEMRLLSLVDSIQRDERIHSPTTPEIEAADAVLILGEDISNTAPRIALAVRQAARNRQRRQAQKLKIPLWQDASVRQLDGDHSPVFIAAVEHTDLDDIAYDRLAVAPQQMAHFGDAVARLLRQPESICDELPEHQRYQAQLLAQILRQAKQPLIICGTGLQNAPLLRAAAEIAAALSEVSLRAPCHLHLACAEANSLGLLQLCPDRDKPLQALADRLRDGDKRSPISLLILENDIFRRLETGAAEQLLASADQVLTFDQLLNATCRHADLIFPAAATAESEGTYINSSGLAQRFYAVYEGAGTIQESWRWLADAAATCRERTPTLDAIAGWQHVSALGEAIAREFPQLQPVAEIGPDENYRIDGLKVARQSHRYSARTAIHADVAVAERKPHTDPDAPMTFSMEGIHNPALTPLQANIWSPGWNSNQALNKFQQPVGGERIGGSGGKFIARETQQLEFSAFPGSGIGVADNRQPFQLVPVYRMFGSDELSSRAPAIASIVPDPFVAMSPQDAERWHVHAGDTIELSLGDRHYQLVVQLSARMPPGSLGIPVGFSGIPAFTGDHSLPAELKLVARAETAINGVDL